MKPLIKSILMMAWLMLVMPNVAMASDNQALSNDELHAGICIIANQGIHTVVSQRQAGIPKSAVKRQLDKDLMQLSKSFSNPMFIRHIGSIWYANLDAIYKIPIMDNDVHKARFISAVTEKGLVSCMKHFGS